MPFALFRPTVSGVAPLPQGTAFTDLDAFQAAPYGFETGEANRRTAQVYDQAPGASAHPWSSADWSEIEAQLQGAGANLKGRLAATARRVSSGAEGQDLDVSGSEGGAKTYEAAGRLRAEDYVAEAGSDVTFRAGEKVVLGPGFQVEAGATFRAETDAALQNEEGQGGSGKWRLAFRSYDAQGRLAKKWVYAPGAPRLALSYDYDRQGRLLYRRAALDGIAEADGGSFCWWYAYEARGLAKEVFAQEGCAAGSQQSRPQTPEVSFAYDAAGQVENTIYKGGTQMPRSYHVRGWLESVGTLDGSTPFGASYAYFDDGNLRRQDWNQTKLGGGAKTYTYSYDALKRLLSADYADNGQGGAYDVAGLGYDGSGNITALKRRGASGALADDLTYTYGAGQSGRKSGRLTSIGDPAGSLHDWDAASGSFAYDRAGRMTQAPAPYEITAASYDERSLPTEHVLATGDTVRYRYSLEGERTYQRSGSGVPTRYLLGAGGANLGTIEGSALENWNLTLPSGSVFGRVEANGSRRYYLKGHLGSVRTAIDENGTAKEARDYYPFGLRLRAGGEMAAAEDFTGHHLDAATGGLLYAGARYLMPALGRWTTIDPLLSGSPAGLVEDGKLRYLSASPYNYVFNNPVNAVDPTGLATCPPDCGGWGALKYAFSWLNFGYEKHVEAPIHKTANQTIKRGEPFTTSLALTSEFYYGYGPERREFGPSHSFTKSLKESNATSIAMEAYAEGMQEFEAGERENPPTQYRVDFSPLVGGDTGPFREAASDLGFTTAQFTGTAMYYFDTASESGKVNVTVYDTKTEYSLFYHIPGTDRHTRGENRAMGRTTQIYHFSFTPEELE